jgi:hypothetical protein
VFRTEHAYPFDWWITPLHVVAALLMSGFDLGIERGSLEVVGDGRAVLNRRWGLLHHHDFARSPVTGLVTSAWAAGIDACRAKYAALARRFFDDVDRVRRAVFLVNRGGTHAGLPGTVVALP